MLKAMGGGVVSAVVIICMGLVWGSLAQQPPPPPCHVQLAQALQRSITFQQTAAQEREAIALYFQEELRKMTEERHALQQRLDELKPQAAKE